MTQAKHTPAPWKLCEVTGTITGNGYRIIDIPDWKESTECTPEQVATARLVAASPLGYDAAIAALEYLCDENPRADRRYEVIEQLKDFLNHAIGE